MGMDMSVTEALSPTHSQDPSRFPQWLFRRTPLGRKGLGAFVLFPCLFPSLSHKQKGVTWNLGTPSASGKRGNENRLLVVRLLCSIMSHRGFCKNVDRLGEQRF